MRNIFVVGLTAAWFLTCIHLPYGGVYPRTLASGGHQLDRACIVDTCFGSVVLGKEIKELPTGFTILQCFTIRMWREHCRIRGAPGTGRFCTTGTNACTTIGSTTGSARMGTTAQMCQRLNRLNSGRITFGSIQVSRVPIQLHTGIPRRRHEIWQTGF